MISLNYTNLNIMWDKIDLRSWKEEKEINVWKQDYIRKIIEDLIELKIEAKKENKPILYDQLRTSLIRAHEVQMGQVRIFKK